MGSWLRNATIVVKYDSKEVRCYNILTYLDGC